MAKTSIVAQFRERKNIPLTIDVPFPLIEPEIVFKVARFAREELTPAYLNATKLLRLAGFEEPKVEDSEDYRKQYDERHQAMLFFSIADVLKRHIKGWEHKPTDGSEPFVFSEAEKESFIRDLGIDGKIQLGMSYTLTMAAEMQKKSQTTPLPTSPSSTP